MVSGNIKDTFFIEIFLYSIICIFLQQMMMQKAQTDLKEEAETKAENRNKYVDENVKPLRIDSLSQDRLRAMCEELYEQLMAAEGNKFDLEVVIRKQDLEVSASCQFASCHFFIDIYLA